MGSRTEEDPRGFPREGTVLVKRGGGVGYTRAREARKY